MWRELFAALGTAARLMAGATGLARSPRHSRASTARGGRQDRDGNNLLAELPNLIHSRVAGAGVAAAVETGLAMLNRPGVRASLEAVVLNLLGNAGEQFQSQEVVRGHADSIARILRQRGIVPNRIGVDGLPGSGKSTLARALAEKLDMKWQSLDHANMNVPQGLTRQGTIYEHQRLLRTQDVDVFDAIVYVDEPVEVSRARVLRRARTEGRQALIIDVLDYSKLKEIGKRAFDVCDGDPISIPRSHLLMNVRPPQGFRAIENTASRLHAAGHNSEGMSKEEMLFLLFDGRTRSGLSAYVLPGAYKEELLRGLLAGARRYLGG